MDSRSTPIYFGCVSTIYPKSNKNDDFTTK